MHPAVLRYVVANTEEEPGRVLDVGGRDTNGNIRGLFRPSTYLCVDIVDAPDVDVAADFLEWAKTMPDSQYDLVLCLEVFEHLADWRDFVRQAWRLLRDGGSFVGTCATNPRNPHGAWGAPQPADGEWYQNVDPKALMAVLFPYFPIYTIDVTRSGDLRWKAIR